VEIQWWSDYVMIFGVDVDVVAAGVGAAADPR